VRTTDQWISICQQCYYLVSQHALVSFTRHAKPVPSAAQCRYADWPLPSAESARFSAQNCGRGERQVLEPANGGRLGPAVCRHPHPRHDHSAAHLRSGRWAGLTGTWSICIFNRHSGTSILGRLEPNGCIVPRDKAMPPAVEQYYSQLQSLEGHTMIHLGGYASQPSAVADALKTQGVQDHLQCRMNRPPTQPSPAQSSPSVQQYDKRACVS
jgi:hypothetical protein